MSPEEVREQQRKEEALHACSLRIPRRPPWNSKMTMEELDSNEKQAFLIWRRSLAKLEENEKLILTPFEKNLDIWRQLWRVLERSDLLVMVVDARDPLFYRCIDLEVYAREIDERKKVMLLMNKADLLPCTVREMWSKYFQTQNIPFLFWSAKAVLEGRVSPPDGNNIKIYGRDELLSRLQSEAEKLAKSDNVVVGFVGYPNVGKSSTINALIGQKRTGVTSTPGKTKHFQTLKITESLTLCDCPGLVFPSFSSSRYEMIASGVLPIDRMTKHREAVQVVADKVPRKTLEAVYGITLPKPRPYELQSRPPHASELLRSFCSSRGFVASGAQPDETRAARLILKDYVEGKLPHYELPPAIPSESSSADDYDGKECTREGGAGGVEEVLDDLNSFDISHGISSVRVITEKKQRKASHKQHKKPPRKKDRSWRARDDDGSGQPMSRVFHMAVHTGPLKVGGSIY